MFVIKHPPKIIFGKNSIKRFNFPENCLVITSQGAKSRNWLNDLDIENFYLFDQVESNPSIETANKIISTFKDYSISSVIGIGGGSSLDVAKFVSRELNKNKIMIPTTFGSGSEVTPISVLKVNNKKQSFHDDKLIPDIAIVDPIFLENTPISILKNSAIDACAQCSEAYDSKNSNLYTKFFCKKAFNVLEDALLNSNYEKLPYGSLLTGIGFGNSSTTLGHALSYVYSNEGVSHGHALAFTTTIAHKFNKSIFYERFRRITEILSFSPIKLQQNIQDAAELILLDKKHLDNNPVPISKSDILTLLKKINEMNF